MYELGDRVTLEEYGVSLPIPKGWVRHPAGEPIWQPEDDEEFSYPPEIRVKQVPAEPLDELVDKIVTALGNQVSITERNETYVDERPAVHLYVRIKNPRFMMLDVIIEGKEQMTTVLCYTPQKVFPKFQRLFLKVIEGFKFEEAKPPDEKAKKPKKKVEAKPKEKAKAKPEKKAEDKPKKKAKEKPKKKKE